MNLGESFLTAMDSLLSNKLRAILTMLGVIIGVAAVIGLMAIGNGVNQSITGEIQSIGTNLISISTNADNSSGYPALSIEDVGALADPLNAPAVTAVAAMSSGQQNVIFGGGAKRATVTGITANYLEVTNLLDFASGDVLTQNDLDTNARVTILGSQMAQDLFGDTFPVGESVKINGVSYEVVGVLNEQGQGFLTNPDDTAYIPLTTAQLRLYPGRTRNGGRAVTQVIAQAASEGETDAAVTQITNVLRDQHGITYADEDDFRIFSQTDLLQTFNTITGTLTAFLGAIAGISLVVGGIGIMNIMLVSVTERTREIGIRKAVGALKRDILMQFLLESILLSLLGGLFGISLGWLIATVAGNALDLTAVVDAPTVLMATSFAAAVGLIFGIYPAWRASGLRPIEALRYE